MMTSAAQPKPPSRRDAIQILEGGHAEMMESLAQLGPRELSRPGVGGGEWSPKDLVGHLASWEERALEAVAAWERGEPAPIDRQFRTRSLSEINAEAVAAKGRLSYAGISRRAGRTHRELLAAIRRMSDERWNAPATSRGRKPLGHRLGQILGGPGGLFRHAGAHLPDLRAFVEE
jgi:hypothetical protein